MAIKAYDVGGVLQWGGLAGVPASLLLRYVEPAPRWDVLACMAVSALGLVVSWVGTRHGPATAPEPPTSRAPSAPTGRRPTGDWWPDRAQRRHLGVLLVLVSAALLLFGSAQHVTPQLADARAGSARIAPVTVTEVRAQSSSPVRGGGTTYTSTVSVALADAAADGQDTPLRGTIKTSEQVRPNGTLWALYRPGREEAHLTATRGELVALRSGTVRPSGVLLGLCAVTAVTGLALLLWRRGKPYSGNETLTDALRDGGVQALAVTLSGTAPEGRRELGVGLRLTAQDGERLLYVSRHVDVEHLADVLYGRTAWLYWERPRNGEPPRERPGRKGEMLPAVLVVGGGDEARYVRGWMPRKPDWPIAQGQALGAIAPESCPAVPQLGSGAVRPPRFRLGAVVWLGLAVLAAAVAFPVGGGGKELVQVAIVAVALCTVLGMRLRQAKWRPSGRRQQRREAEASAEAR